MSLGDHAWSVARFPVASQVARCRRVVPDHLPRKPLDRTFRAGRKSPGWDRPPEVSPRVVATSIPIIRGRDTVVAGSLRRRVEVVGVVFALGVVGLLALPVTAGASSTVTASEVSVGSPHNIAPRSHQNEP